MPPRVGIEKLVDMVVCAEDVDVWLVIERGLIAVDRTSGCS
jgi:hypothetical protein